MSRRIIFPFAAVLTAAALVLLGGALSGPSGARPVAANSSTVVTDRLLGGFSPGDTQEYVRRLERQVAGGDDSEKALVLLGLGYQQLARESGDPASYEPSERALRRALRTEPESGLALTGLASLAASRHRFNEARSFALRAIRANPYGAVAWGILGDAEVETGRYRSAFAAFERMVSLKPSVAAYARISYARELLGRTRPAIAAMRQAVEAAAGADEPGAWSRVQLGNLYAESGRLGPAAREYRRALAQLPEHAPAIAGLAKLESWRGRDLASATLYRRALELQPVPEYAVALGDALGRAGRTAEANGAFRRAGELEDAFTQAGGRNQLETALFDLDHGLHLETALVRAYEGRRLRPSVEGEHVFAWALYKNGRCTDARQHSVRALRLGTKDWGAMLHRSLIESCLGDEAAAGAFRERALAANPYALVAFGPLADHRF